MLAFILLAVQSLVVGVAHVHFSSQKHSSTAAVVIGFVVLFAVLTVLLVALARRRRWAWLVFVALYGPGLVLDVFDFNGAIEFVLDVIRFGLLVSSSMRRYVGIASFDDWR